MRRKLTPIFGTSLGDFWEVFGKYGLQDIVAARRSIYAKKTTKDDAKREHSVNAGVFAKPTMLSKAIMLISYNQIPK